MPITEKEFLDQLISFQQHAPNFKEWDAIHKHHKSAIKYAKWRRVRTFRQFTAFSLLCLVAYVLYRIKIFEFLTESDCLVPAFEPLQDIFRPPQSECEYCKIDAIHVRSNLTEEEFFRVYAYSGLPLLVSDGMRDWTTDKFDFQYFKDLYANTTIDDNKDCQFFSYRTDFEDLVDLFSMDQERAEFKPGTEPWYVGWSNCVPQVAAELRKHYTVPYFLGASERTRMDWVFVGSPGYKGAPLHIDFVDYNSWQAQIKGRKKWQFSPAPECWYECAHSHTVVVEPGNVFIFDSNRWFHSTEVLEGEFSLTIGSEYD